MVVQNLVDPMHCCLNFAVLQVSLVEPPKVVTVFKEDLSFMAPFYVFTTVNNGSWLQYILPAPKCQLLRILEDMQPLSLNGASPLPIFVCFFFTKFRFGLLAMAVHGFLNLLPMDNLKNSNGTFIQRPIQHIYKLRRPTNYIYNLLILDFRCMRHGARMNKKCWTPLKYPVVSYKYN
jgi:hypothetical protein